MSINLCDILSVTCFLTDEDGVPLNPLLPGSIVCQEIPQSDGRKNVNTSLPNGDPITLQKVKFRKKGFVVIKIVGPETFCLSDPFPFNFIETVILCAPDGTDLKCDVTNFECDAILNCKDGLVTSVDLFFDICQSIEMNRGVIIAIDGSFCNPRSEAVPVRSKMTLPNDFSAIFPANSSQEIIEDKEQDVEVLDDYSVPRLFHSQQELACLSVEKVYDWIVRQSSFQLNLNINDLTIKCDVPPCAAHLFVHAAYVCEADLQGQVLCGDIPVAGAEVFYSAEPDIITFSPNPSLTDPNGHFDTIVTISPGTPPTPVTITAVTEVSGLTLSDSLETIVECPDEPYIIELFAADTIECDGFVAGRVMRGERVIEGAVVMLTSDPDVVIFAHNPITTGSDGNFFLGVTVAPGTPSQMITITATTDVEGQIISETVDVNVECPLDACELTLEVPVNIDCEADITGNISCGGIPVDGAEISFSSFPDIATFSPVPAISDVNGNFSITVSIPENTPFESVLISATTTVNGQTVFVHVGSHVECLPVECPCKFRIGVSGNRAPAIVNITEQGIPLTLAGTINVTSVQCFIAGPGCNPAVDNFNITFGSDGTTINFIQGRRVHIFCTDSNTARVHGTAMASGNLFSGVFEVLIEVTVLPANVGTWTIFAQDLMGNSFDTSFTATMNPITFIGPCEEPI